MKSVTTLTTLFQFTIAKMNEGVFTFTTIKMNSLTTLTTLFYFTTTNPRDRTTITYAALISYPPNSFPQEFQYFHKICMCHSNLTVRKFSGVLHALLPLISEMK